MTAATAAPVTPSIFAPVSTPAFAIRDLSFRAVPDRHRLFLTTTPYIFAIERP
jgi:hypothetical protein